MFRGIAAMAVVTYHYFFRFDQLYGHVNIPVEWARLGLYGVHFFFLISGFVIYWSLQRSAGLWSFLLSRFSRIFPAYWVALLLTFSIVGFAGLPGREFGFFELLVNFSMVQEYLSVAHIDQAYWTLTAEVTFYFWIILMLLTGRLPQVEYWFIPLMLLGAAYHLELVEIPLRVTKFLLIKHANLFAAGIMFYRIHTGTERPATRWLLLLSMAINFTIYPWPDGFFIMLFYGLFYLAITGRLSSLCVAPLLWLGGVSYTLYLLHQNIGYVVIRGVYAVGGSGWLGIMLAMLVVLGLADLLSRKVERPAARWMRKKFG